MYNRLMTEEIPKIEKATVGKQTFFQRIFKVKHFLVMVGVVFIVLAILARNIPYFPFDLIVTRAIQQISIPGFGAAMLLLTNLGNLIPASLSLIAISGVLLVLKKKVAVSTTLFSSLGLSMLGVLLKAIVARPRPDSVLIHQLGQFIKPDNFPSGHVLWYMGLYGFLLVFVFTEFKKSQIRGVLLTILTVLLIGIGFSRIYVGAHWFSDVLGSYLLGFVWLYFMTQLYKKYAKKSPRN